MPFTASHPAIILPLLKRRVFSASGLIMGSMVPDFEFFLRFEANGPHGHSVWGMLWLNVPIASLFITLYHVLVRNQMILNLPIFFRKRFADFLEFNWIAYLKSNFFKVIISILVGNFSHLLWDSFTHFDGFFVTKMAFFNEEVYQIPVYSILQYGFSLLGALAIWSFIVKMPEVKIVNQTAIKNILGYWFMVFFITVLVYFIRYFFEDYNEFGERIVILCAGFLIGLILSSSVFNLIHPKKHLALSKDE
ncbi:DUF4184 family protein [Aurantibacter sp.]|uniref:DUF4184 family protein n=1 Tax=Aurantibacter sp. TaxID=2807103 RepID=UPI0032644D20